MRKPASLLSIFLLLFLACRLTAQQDSLSQSFGVPDFLENFAQDQELDADFDYNDLTDRLERLRRRPLDLNQLTASDLDYFPFLTEIQKVALLEHRQKLGDFRSIFELQAVPFFDLLTIRKLLPFVKLDQPGALQTPLHDLTAEDKSQLILRWARTVEPVLGFLPPTDSTLPIPYTGDRNRLYFRYRYTAKDKISIGLTGEKDAGEQFFKGSNLSGFDFYSAHFFLQNPVKKIKRIILGDFSASLGQGLILYQGFASGKSVFSTSIRRGGVVVRPYSSVNEVDFFRGVATTLALARKLELTLFGSRLRKDGNFIQADTLDPDEPDVLNSAYVSSLQTSGLHRTVAEIEDENALLQTSTGGQLRWQERRWHIAANGLLHHFSEKIQPRPSYYNRYFFSGNRMHNLSLDYGFVYQNIQFFGETARSGNGAVATLNGALFSLDRKVDISVLHRHFPRHYQSLNPQPFAETNGASNEDGLFLGLTARPQKGWQLNAYFDLWNHPWARFNADLPSNGHEWLARITYTKRRKMEAYLQFRNEVKEENSGVETSKSEPLVTRQNFSTRAQFSVNVSKALELRSRLDWGFQQKDGEKLQGVAIYQDILYKAIGTPLSLTARFAIFDTDDYAIRFYAYENDLLNDFSIPALYERGTRFYVNLRYQLGRKLILEGRYAVTRYANQETIGSGLDLINGSRRRDLKAQLRWEF